MASSSDKSSSPSALVHSHVDPASFTSCKTARQNISPPPRQTTTVKPQIFYVRNSFFCVYHSPVPVTLADINFRVTPCINNIQNFIFYLTHTTLKNVELLKHFKIKKLLQHVSVYNETIIREPQSLLS